MRTAPLRRTASRLWSRTALPGRQCAPLQRAPEYRVPRPFRSDRAVLRLRLGNLLGVVLQRGRVDAVPQPGRLGAVLEHVAKVAAAVAALHLAADHAVAAVLLGLDRVILGRRPEAGPA